MMSSSSSSDSYSSSVLACIHHGGVSLRRYIKRAPEEEQVTPASPTRKGKCCRSLDVALDHRRAQPGSERVDGRPMVSMISDPSVRLMNTADGRTVMVEDAPRRLWRPDPLKTDQRLEESAIAHGRTCKSKTTCHWTILSPTLGIFPILRKQRRLMIQHMHKNLRIYKPYDDHTLTQKSDAREEMGGGGQW